MLSHTCVCSDESYNPDSIAPLYLAATFDGSRICASINGSGRYLPVFRYPDAASRKFFDTLVRQRVTHSPCSRCPQTPSQQRAFYAALVIYVVAAVVAYYRLLSVGMDALRKGTFTSQVVMWVLASLILTRACWFSALYD